MPLALLLLALNPPSPVEPGAVPVKVSTGFSFTEGPACAKNGDVFFTDQPNDRIYRWDGTKSEIWKSPAGRANGTAFDRTGNLIVCADGQNELWSVTPKGETRVLLGAFEGKLLNGPNDVWIHPNGRFYFTDPLYPRPYWSRSKEGQQPGEYVYLVSPDGKGLRPVATDLKKPNGIVGTPDGKTLYVSDIGNGETFRYRIEKDGSLSDKTLFCKLGSDGMSLDDKGNVYLSGQGVTIFDRSGKQIDHLDIPESWTGNVTFGGRDRRTLFVTASTSIYTVQMKTRGAD